MAAKLSPGGKARHTVQQNAEINVTPFVDVMLVLLIIFMVAAPLATKKIDLENTPPRPPVDNRTPPEPIYISVGQNGALFIGDRPTSSRTLVTDLYARIGKGKASVNDRVMIRAEADVPYGDFMGVMNELKANGFRKVGLISEDIS